MKFFLDTEFSERGSGYPIILLSLGIATETGRSFYAVTTGWEKADCNGWVQKNVLPHLWDRPEDTFHGDIIEVADLVGGFVAVHGNNEKPEFWGYYADYDWVAFCQLFGTMMDLPRGWPMYCRDLKQWCDSLGNPQLPAQVSTEHHALNDAEWVRECYAYLATMATDPTRLPYANFH